MHIITIVDLSVGSAAAGTENAAAVDAMDGHVVSAWPSCSSAGSNHSDYS